MSDLSREVHTFYGETLKFALDAFESLKDFAFRIEDLEAQNKELLEALELALGSHNRLLLSDPPKDAWVFNGVEAKAREVIAKIKGEE
jgi:hypothetical protein